MGRITVLNLTAPATPEAASPEPARWSPMSGKAEGECYAERMETINGQIVEFSKARDAEAAERGGNQNAMAELALQRLRKDEEIETRRHELLELLAERDEITRQMAGTAQTFDLNCRSWGEEQAQALSAALSADFLEASEKWLRWFTGALEALPGYSPYIVSCDSLTLPETLAHSGVYHFGERVWLTDAEAAPLLAETKKEKRQIEPEADYRQAETESVSSGFSDVRYRLMQRRDARLAAARERKLRDIFKPHSDSEYIAAMGHFLRVKAG